MAGARVATDCGLVRPVVAGGRWWGWAADEKTDHGEGGAVVDGRAVGVDVACRGSGRVNDFGTLLVGSFSGKRLSFGGGEGG